MLNFLKSLLLATLATYPVFFFTPLLFVIWNYLIDGTSILKTFVYLASDGTLLALTIIAGIETIFALFVGGAGAFLVDKLVLIDGGTKKQYALAGAIVGFAGSWLFGFSSKPPSVDVGIIVVSVSLAGFAGGWVFGANRKITKKDPG